MCKWVKEWRIMGLIQYCVELQLYSIVIQLPSYPTVQCLIFLQFTSLKQLSFFVIAIHLFINDLDFQTSRSCPLNSKHKLKLKIKMSEFYFESVIIKSVSFILFLFIFLF